MTTTGNAIPPVIPEWTIRHKRLPWWSAQVPGGARLPLGRHVYHDSRNLYYRYQRSAPTLVSVLHTRNIPILDQGDVGSCTGNGEVGVLGTTPNYASVPTGIVLDEAAALRIYSGAETIDGDGPYPPNDNGSSGPSAAKSAMKLGLISGYTHCLSLSDVLDALQTQAVSIGINWYDSFDSPAATGMIAVSPGAEVRGGHEPMLRGIDVTAKTVFGDNSWGLSWGLSGSFEMTWGTLERLLAEDGDGTVSVPLSAPAPTPTPPPVPVPTPVPGPTPNADDALLWAHTAVWAGERHVSGNKAAAQSVTTWAKAKGFK